MTNETLNLEMGAVYAEPDGCLYTWCDGRYCPQEGLIPFGEDAHFQPSQLGELTKVIAPDGHVLVENIIDRSKGSSHPGKRP